MKVCKNYQAKYTKVKKEHLKTKKEFAKMHVTLIIMSGITENIFHLFINNFGSHKIRMQVQ